MATTQYIGARYVPLFSDPLDWDNTKAYEALTIVYYQGNSYTSRQSVPEGVEITNDKYWALTGNYNAQIETYRKEVTEVVGKADEAVEKATEAETKVATEETRATNAENELATGISNLGTRITEAETKVTTEETRAKAAEEALNDKISSFKQTTKNANILCISDSYGRGVGNDDKGWIDYFAECEPTAHVRNISNSGAGFIAQGHSDPYGAVNFAGQLEYAADNPEEGISNEDISFVVIGGGWNDNAQEMSNVESYVSSCYDTAKRLFANAEVWIFSLSNELNNLDAKYLNTGISITKACRDNGIRTNGESWYWLKGNRFVSSSDGIHPNSVGYNAIGKAIYLSLQGISIGSQNSNLGYGASTSSIVTSSNFRDVIKNGIVYLDGEVTASFTTSNTTFLTIPSMYAPRHTLYFMAQFFPSSGSKVVAPVAVLSDGQVAIRTPFDGSISTGTLYFTIQYPLATL